MIQNFSKDNMLSAYGFGCDPKITSLQIDNPNSNDCFAMNGNMKDPRINGI